MGEPRELILKLGQKITDRIGVKVTVNDPEYWGLAGVVTDEMAEVALAMKVRVPDTAENIAKKCGKSLERTEELLKEMSVIGIIEYNWENEDRHKQYILPMFVPGCAEFMVMNGKQVEEHPEIADFFEQMSRLPLEKVTPMVPPGGAGIGMHVIPVEKAIPAAQQSASVEHISYWLNKYKDKYAVGACSCRRQQRVRGEGTGEIEGELCIGVGDMADYLVVLNQPSMERFSESVKNGGALFVNSSIVTDIPQYRDIDIVPVEAGNIAAELGTPKVMNLVMTGAVIGYSDLLPADNVLQTAFRKLGAKRPELNPLNEAAFKRGLEIGKLAKSRRMQALF